ncbi:MAG: hypothetical protein K9M98_07655 [Cephaloticoccus sp.]|nr:hypothetical protein [Cephaloticoccus sp.]MCF7760366.1 hypothetical protein [Cephaloticoccus sp.]
MTTKGHILTLCALTLFGSASAFAYTEVAAGEITTNTKWTVSGSPYILQGIVYVKDGAVLDIEPGTIIRGQPRTDASTFDPGALVITPTGKIQARGTVANPIVFTTAAQSAGGGIFTDANTDNIADRWIPANGDSNYLDADPNGSPLPPKNTNGVKNANMWGGLVLMGDSFTNNGGEVDVNSPAGIGTEDDGYGIAEGLSGANAVYGGVNSEHNAGILKYVSIRHGGAELVSGKELNGLTCYAIGSKSTVSYIDVYATGDDGMEIFGGTANFDHINLNYCDDDGLDMDEGFQGTIQFVFILQGKGYGDSGMELDGEDKAEGFPSTPIFPVGDARIYNASVLTNSEDNAGGSRGVRMRAGFTGLLANSIVKNFASVAAGTGIAVDTITGIETEPSARTQFNLGYTQLRNNSVHNYTTAYTAHGPGTGSVTISATGAVTGTYASEAIANVYYPTTLNRTLDTGIPTPNHDSANGIDPRPSLSANALAYGTTLSDSYVTSPAVYTAYKGAFDRTATTLWTTLWTALNKRGILKN